MSLKDLIWLSNASGMQPDWIQAGGGNTSWKKGDSLFIKASGTTLSEMDKENGIVEVKLSKVCELLEDPNAPKEKSECDAWATRELQQAVKGNARGQRPSMETFLHAMLGKIVFHGHPWAVNAVMQNPTHFKAFQSTFPENKNISYETPGIHLGRELKKIMEQDPIKEKETQIITLENHGLIVSGPNADTVFKTTCSVVFWCHDYIGSPSQGLILHELSIQINKISKESLWIVPVEHYGLQRLSAPLIKQLMKGPIIPDQQVYCGYHLVEIIETEQYEAIESYCQKYAEGPKVILMEGQLFIRAKNMKKAKEAEAVLWGCVQSLRYIETPVFLSESETQYLGNWEAEAYRRSL